MSSRMASHLSISVCFSVDLRRVKTDEGNWKMREERSRLSVTVPHSKGERPPLAPPGRPNGPTPA